MHTAFSNRARNIPFLGLLLLFLNGAPILVADPPSAAVAQFNAYSRSVEERLALQHRLGKDFLVSPASDRAREDARLRQGDLVIGRVTPAGSDEFNGALLHHWRGTAFASGAKAADFERIMRDFQAYPKYFAPEVLEARVLSEDRSRDSMSASMRIRQRHVITVVMDATYDISFGQLDAAHGYSLSRSTQIREIDSPGTPAEHALAGNEEHGFLWRLNTYWGYEERDGGLYLQIEAVSLTRSVPRGLRWAIDPFVESIPRESLEFTLRSVCNALRK